VVTFNISEGAPLARVRTGTLESIVDSHAYYDLQILNHLEQAPYTTNRVAAAKLGVSVKLTHSVLKGLIRRGCIHVRKRDGRSLYYLLTPKGIAEKVRLTYAFLDFSTQFYREARRRSSEVCKGLALAGVKAVAFLGCGDLAEISYLGVKEHGLVLTEVFDDAAAGRMFLGLVVKPVSEVFPKETMHGQARFERVLVTAYDPTQPARRRYLPPGVAPDERLVWVFDSGEMVEETVSRARRAGGIAGETGR
jgi:hypothetical protein